MKEAAQGQREMLHDDMHETQAETEGQALGDSPCTGIAGSKGTPTQHRKATVSLSFTTEILL